MPRYLHAQLYAVLTDDAEPTQEVFATEVNEGDPDEAAHKLIAWIRAQADDLEQGLRD